MTVDCVNEYYTPVSSSGFESGLEIVWMGVGGAGDLEPAAKWVSLNIQMTSLLFTFQ